MKEQSAVEWFAMITAELGYVSKDQLEQANKMFEKQIINAFEMGQINVYENHNIDSDDYYQLNFKTE